MIRGLTPQVVLPTMARLLVVLLVLIATIAVSRGVALISQPLNENLVGRILLSENRADEAMYVFESPAWRGVALYRAGRFNRAIGEFSNDRNIRSLYNIGTAYAQLGRYDEAVQVYEDVLTEEPNHEDARHNLELVRQAAALSRSGNDSGNAGLENRDNETTPDRSEQPRSESVREDIIQTERNQPTSDEGEEETNEETADDEGADHNPGNDGSQSGGQAGTPGQQSERELAPKSATSLSDDDEPAAELPLDSLTQQNPSKSDASEDQIAEKILLRHIKDDPKVVLRARLRMAFNRSLEDSQ